MLAMLALYKPVHPVMQDACRRHWWASDVKPEVTPPGHGHQVSAPQVRHLMRYGVCHHEIPATGRRRLIAACMPFADMSVAAGTSPTPASVLTAQGARTRHGLVCISAAREQGTWQHEE